MTTPDSSSATSISDSSPFSFSDLGLSSQGAAIAQRLGFTEPTPIQRQSIPIALSGADIIGRAQTGSGKTAAFSLPILERIERSAEGVQALVLTPTRELACQVAEAIRLFAAEMPWVRVAVLYGGSRYDKQMRELRDRPQIVVATPGRLMDHQRRGSVSLDKVRIAVLDEADEMLAMGFKEDVETILSTTPATKQTLLFSATMPDSIRGLAQQFLREPVDVSVQSSSATAPSIDQRFWIVTGMTKIEALNRLLTAVNFSAMVVFVRTKAATIEVAESLSQRGHDAVALHGDMRQLERERVVEDLRAGKRRLLVATDVAARGLDLTVVSHVVNFDLPGDLESYIHRIGRTGRAGREGMAIAFVTPRERHRLRALERVSAGRLAPFVMPTASEIRQVRIDRFREEIRRIAQQPVVGSYRPIIEGMVEEGGLSAVDVAAAVSALLHQGNHLLPPERRREARSEGRTRELAIPVNDDEERREPPQRRRVASRSTDDIPYERRERRPSSDRPERPIRERSSSRAPAGRGEVLCEIAGGSNDGLTVSAVVAALAEATGIPGRLLGSVRISAERSTVALPADAIGEAKKRLRRLWIIDKRYRVEAVEKGPVQRDEEFEKRPRTRRTEEPRVASARSTASRPARTRDSRSSRAPERPTTRSSRTTRTPQRRGASSSPRVTRERRPQGRSGRPSVRSR